MDVVALASRRDELRQRRAALESSLAVIDSDIQRLCRELGYEGVPTEDSLVEAIRIADVSVCAQEEALLSLESQLSAWEDSYAAMSKEDSVEQLSDATVSGI